MRLRAAFLAAFLGLSGPVRAASLEAQVTTSAGMPVEDSAVVLEPASGTVPKPHRMATIEQRDREFIPYLIIVQTGTAIQFPNHDPFKHHVYSFSPAKTFEIKLYAGKPAQPIVFDKAGEVDIGCNIHDWMEAYVLVVDTPYFATTDSKGRAVIAQAPPGRYRLRLWHPRQKAVPPVREIELGAAAAKIDLVLDVAPRVRKPKPPADADHY